MDRRDLRRLSRRNSKRPYHLAVGVFFVVIGLATYPTIIAPIMNPQYWRDWRDSYGHTIKEGRRVE